MQWYLNDIDNPYNKLCIPDVVKSSNVNNLMSRINEIRNVS